MLMEMRMRLRSTVASSSVAFVALACFAFAPAALAQDIAPPPPMDPNQPGAPGNPTTTPEQQQSEEQKKKLDEAEKEDSGRNFELFWLNADIGGSYIDMRQLSEDNFKIEKASAGGPMFGVGGGVRFVILVLGANLRYNALSSFNLWQINGEAGLKIPISKLDLLFGLHGGYSFVGRLGDASVGTSSNVPSDKDAVKIRGFNGGFHFAVDYYVSQLFSVGGGVFADLLFLNRPPLDKPAGYDQLTPDQKAAIESDPTYQRSGTSIGLQLGGGLRLGLHFGL
jgi:hypothetical protein